METFPTFATVAWDLICWPIATPGAQGSALTSGTFYLMHLVAGVIFKRWWGTGPRCPGRCDLTLDNWNLIHLKVSWKTTQVFQMAALLLLNMTIIQAGAHYTDRLIPGGRARPWSADHYWLFRVTPGSRSNVHQRPKATGTMLNCVAMIPPETSCSC